MTHCNPAPPHPDPGQVFNVICLPSLEIAIILTAIPLIATIIVYYRSNDDVHAHRLLAVVITAVIIAYVFRYGVFAAMLP